MSKFSVLALVFTLLLMFNGSLGARALVTKLDDPSLLRGLGTAGQIKLRVSWPKPSHASFGRMPLGHTIIVKFTEGRPVRLRDGRLISLAGDDMTGLNAVIEKFSRQLISIGRVFIRSETELTAEKRELEMVSKEELEDLNLYYRLKFSEGVEILDVIDALNALAIVESAYPQPLPTEAPSSPLLVTPSITEALQTTPDFTSQQGYLNPAPDGINDLQA